MDDSHLAESVKPTADTPLESVKCADGVYREVHKLDCDCDHCQTRRLQYKQWQEAELLEWEAIKKRAGRA